MPQELDEGKSSYRGMSWKLRVSYTKKSAEVIVGNLWYELKDMTAEVERTDCPSYPTKR
jgi:hypothetical protein